MPIVKPSPHKSGHRRIRAYFAYRMMNEHFTPQQVEALWAYVRQHGFRCYYTGMRLEMDDDKSPWYCSFDHWKPRDSRKVVITSSLVNDMKSDLTEAEFWYMVHQLANFRRKGIKVRKRKFTYWCRPYAHHKANLN